ncbi:MAG: hypothetical protein HY744_16330 [Deltaproteobacteria bacterium]|nr:hypothetical protein [Deltaproteobacteria bacterium]
MPGGSDPPDPRLPQSVFDALHPMTYDSTDMAFVDGQGTKYYMCVERQSGYPERCQWFYGTDAEAAANPLGKIPQATYNIIHNGTYVPASYAVSYRSVNYKFQIARDGSGVHISKAEAV